MIRLATGQKQHYTISDSSGPVTWHMTPDLNGEKANAVYQYHNIILVNYTLVYNLKITVIKLWFPSLVRNTYDKCWNHINPYKRSTAGRTMCFFFNWPKHDKAECAGPLYGWCRKTSSIHCSINTRWTQKKMLKSTHFGVSVDDKVTYKISSIFPAQNVIMNTLSNREETTAFITPNRNCVADASWSLM